MCLCLSPDHLIAHHGVGSHSGRAGDAAAQRVTQPTLSAQTASTLPSASPPVWTAVPTHHPATHWADPGSDPHGGCTCWACDPTCAPVRCGCVITRRICFRAHPGPSPLSPEQPHRPQAVREELAQLRLAEALLDAAAWRRLRGRGVRLFLSTGSDLVKAVTGKSKHRAAFDLACVGHRHVHLAGSEHRLQEALKPGAMLVLEGARCDPVP